MATETYPDPAAWAERQTDAGTRPAYELPVPLDEQEEPDLDSLDTGEAFVIAVVIGGWIWLAVAWVMGWLA